MSHNILYLAGYTYTDEEVELPGDKKIGITGKDDATLDGRFQQLSGTKGPIGVRCLVAWEIKDAARHEYLLHQLLTGLRSKGEWFSDPDDSLVIAVAEYMQANGGSNFHTGAGVKLKKKKQLSGRTYHTNVSKAHALASLIEEAVPGCTTHPMTANLTVRWGNNFLLRILAKNNDFNLRVKRKGISEEDIADLATLLEPECNTLTENVHALAAFGLSAEQVLSLVPQICARVTESVEDID